jgi:hypothetical protein
MDTAPKTFADPSALLSPTGGGKIRGACHCRTVQFEVALTDGLATARRCTCSYCRMRGAIAVSAQLGGLNILAGEHALSRYTFNTGAAQHFFCSHCGIYTHHQRRSNPNQYGINVACLEGLSPFDFAQVPVLNGISHPSDKGPGAPARLAGLLRFVPTPEDEP